MSENPANHVFVDWDVEHQGDLLRDSRKAPIGITLLHFDDRWLHAGFLQAISWADEDPSNKLLGFETQLAWLREIGFIDVDCHWKWRELALLAGVKPTVSDRP
jgi:hypothetical protein